MSTVDGLRAEWAAAAERLDAALNRWSAALDITGTSDPDLIAEVTRLGAEHRAAFDAYRAVRDAR